jgi:ribosomal-protein-alanine N-acetyltransferase
MNINIRKFEWKDIKKVLEIEQKSFEKDRWDEIEFMKYYEEAGDGFIVCEEKNEIIGYAIVNKQGYIRSIAVKPKFRRRGIGKLLLDAIENIAQKNKNEKLSLHVRLSNHDAIEFYHNNGFKDIQIFKKVHPGGEDAIYMEKDLRYD